MSFASPPCLAHEFAGTDDGFAAVDAQTASDVARWRKAERQRLIAARKAVPGAERRAVGAAVARVLDGMVGDLRDPVVSVYWPFRCELDLIPWMRSLTVRGIRVALPVVEQRARPLAFRAWRPGCRMRRGVWDIPVPDEGECLIPDVVIAPVVGFDHDCYRLGNGGGYFDRTLAALSPRPLAIGVGHPGARIPTIYPQPHDIPMDVIVTGSDAILHRGRDAWHSRTETGT